jgi:hypothetical protein
MTSFSSLEFDKLFNTTGNDKIVYYTDKIYGYKDFDTGFKDMVNLKQYFNPVSNVKVSRYSKVLLDEIIEGKSSAVVPADNKNWTRGADDVLVMDYSQGMFDTVIAERIYTDLINVLGDPNEATSKQKLSEVATNHRIASTFMENIVLSICNWKYANVKTELEIALKNNTEMISDVITAGREIQLMNGPKEASIISNLHNTCSEVLATIVKNQAPSVYKLEGFAESPSFSLNRFRTTLREAMFSKLILREYAGNNSVTDQVLMYVRRLLVELYIIAYYPYIHFQYINELLKKFKEAGNFVNMRVAALVRVAFTINVLLWYYQEGSEKFKDKVAKQNVIVTQWAETLKNYMTALSRVDFKNKDASIQNVISDLHTLSSKVSTQSMSVDQLKESIVASQIQVRSIISRLKQINKERARKMTQYSVLVFLLLLVVVISAVLLTFNLFKNYVLYSLIGICTIIIMYKLVISIMELVKIAKR